MQSLALLHIPHRYALAHSETSSYKESAQMCPPQFCTVALIFMENEHVVVKLIVCRIEVEYDEGSVMNFVCYICSCFIPNDGI